MHRLQFHFAPLHNGLPPSLSTTEVELAVPTPSKSCLKGGGRSRQILLATSCDSV